MVLAGLHIGVNEGSLILKNLLILVQYFERTISFNTKHQLCDLVYQ